MSRKLLMVLLIFLLIPSILPAKNESSRLKELGKKVHALDIKRRSEGQRLRT